MGDTRRVGGLHKLVVQRPWPAGHMSPTEWGRPARSMKSSWEEEILAVANLAFRDTE